MDRIVSAHGTFHTSHCITCSKPYQLEWIKGVKVIFSCFSGIISYFLVYSLIFWYIQSLYICFATKMTNPRLRINDGFFAVCKQIHQIFVCSFEI